MEPTTVLRSGDRESKEPDKKRGLAMPILLHDFKAAMRTSEKSQLQPRILHINDDKSLQCSISVDFSTDYVYADVSYFATVLPCRSYEMICTLSDINEADRKKKVSLSHRFQFKNLWLTVVGDWRPLCTFPAILLRDELMDYIENDVRFLLMFKFIEEDPVEFTPSIKILSEVFENETFADFTIIADNQEFKVHRAVLATASDFFNALFHSQMTEQRENQVVINDVEPKVIKEMLRFIYTGHVDNILEIAEKLLIVADRYRLDHLKEYCAKQLEYSIKTHNAMNTLLIADTYNDVNLRKGAMQFIRRNLREVLQKEENVEILNARSDFAVEILLNLV